jgi:hypothetical protein
MRKSLLIEVLVAEALAACWSPPPPVRSESPAPTTPPQLASTDSSPCRESGERLALVVCRSDDDLAWTVTNHTDVTLWVFVAPPSIYKGKRARENAFVEARDGNIVLQKLQLPGPMDEPIMSGAIALAPGMSDSGVVPLGPEFVPDARNFWLRSRTRQHPSRQWIKTVTLEVGYAERRSADRPIPPDAHQEYYLFMALEKSRQTFVRSPALPWR